MRVTGIEIERFGVWENYSRSLSQQGLSVFYGPNEAGKTTLLRFIRGILYGFRPEERTTPRRIARRQPQVGGLKLEHRGLDYQVRRASYDEEPGLVSIAGIDGAQSTARLLSELVSGTDEKLFESVFAVGLPELQQFATLTEDEVARHLYGMTLGPQGRLLMELPDRIEDETVSLLDQQHGSGELPRLWKLRDDLTQQLAGVRRQRDQHRELLRRRSELDAVIRRMRDRQTEIQHRLRSLQHLERVWAPWSRVREYERELQSLPDFQNFPSDGVARLDQLETDIRGATQQRDLLLTDARNLAQRAQAIGRDPEIRRFGGAIQMLAEQRPYVAETDQQLPNWHRDLGEAEKAAATDLAALGAGWTEERLLNLTDDPDSPAVLMNAARTFQLIHRRVRSNQRRYQYASQACRDKELALRTELLGLGASAEDLAGPTAVAKQRLNQLVALGRLQLEAADMRQRLAGLDEQLQRLQVRNGLPDWVYVILGMFALGGTGLLIAGFVAGISHAWIVGLIYCVLSLFACGMTWALKLQYEHDLEQRVEEVRTQRRELQERLHDADRRIAELRKVHDLPESKVPTGLTTPVVDGDQLAAAARRLSQLEQAQQTWAQIHQQRRKLTVARGKLQNQVRELSAARKTWCETLRSIGLDETVNADAAFEQWRRLLSARDRFRTCVELRQRLASQRHSWDRFRRHVEELGRRMQRGNHDFQQPLAVLSQWEAEFHTANKNRMERKRLLRDQQQRRLEAARVQKRIDAWESEHAALLAHAGVTSRSQLDHRLELRERRRQVEQLVAQTRRELETIASSQADLAIVEDDLIAWKLEDHKSRIRQTEKERDDIERDLEQTFEQLGTLKQELKTLEQDRRGSRLRRELNEVEDQLSESIERWFGTQLAAEAVDAVGARFEQDNQPEMLAAAIPFLQRLTLGKYVRLWTPLGRRQLFVDDDQGRSMPAELLSGGTREQLFLAIRLAMVRDFARQGIELPMILDDVTVNFDQQRAEAAVETLMDFAKDGQQLLVFTSHLHFAQMFERRGVEPVWLPARHPSQADHYIERLAG